MFEEYAKKLRRRTPKLLHCYAWLVTVLVGIVVIIANVFGDLYTREPIKNFMVFIKEAGVEKEYVTYHGWPIFCCESKLIINTDRSTTESDPTFHPILLIFNIVADLLIVTSTFFVFVFPFWKRKPFQVKLISFFILTTSIAVFFAFYRVPIPIDPFGVFDTPSLFSDIPHFFYLNPLPIQIPLGIGIVCTIYMGIWLALRLVTALVKILVKRRPVTQSE